MNEASFLERLKQANLRQWLELEAIKLADTDQYDRWLKGMLSHTEVEKLARDNMFGMFEEIAKPTKWQPLRWAHVPHARDCHFKESADHRKGEVAGYSSLELMPIMDAVEVLNVEHHWLRHSGATAYVTVDKHELVCGACKHGLLGYSATVHIPWGEREFTRMYSV